MTMTYDRPSAEIYQFPPRGRFAVASHCDQSRPDAAMSPSRVPTTVFGANWYHEEAIQEAERARKS
jgi:Protein of unknown function (DUF2735)